MKNIAHLENEKIGKLLARFSIPAIIGMLTNASYNLVDRVFVGQGVGSLAISGIMITFPIVMLIMAFSMLIGIGGTSMISIRLGEKRKDDAENILGNALTMVLIVSAIITLVLYLFTDNILVMLGGVGQTLAYAKSYTYVMAVGVIFQMISFSLNAIIRGEGNPRIAMFTMLIGGVINIVLNPLFVFAFKWGIQGSAWATVIGQIVSAAWVIGYFFGGKSLLKVRTKYMRLKFTVFKDIFSIGMSPFFMQIASSIVIAMFNNSLHSHGGEVAVACNGVINSLVMLFYMPIFGLNQGLQPIAGFNWGAKQYHRVREALNLGILVATVFGTTGGLILFLFPELWISMFASNDPELINVGVRAIRIFVVTMPITGFAIMTGAYFQAVGKAGISLFLTLTRQIGIIIPCILILPMFFGLDGVWATTPLSDLISTVIIAGFYFYEIRRLKSLEAAAKLEVSA